MHKNHEIFIEALLNKKKVKLDFYSKEDSFVLSRICAPMDFGPSRRAKDKADRYHLWDYESDTKLHTLSLLENQILNIILSTETFNPGEFISWDLVKSPWFYKRNWEEYS